MSRRELQGLVSDYKWSGRSEAPSLGKRKDEFKAQMTRLEKDIKAGKFGTAKNNRRAASRAQPSQPKTEEVQAPATKTTTDVPEAFTKEATAAELEAQHTGAVQTINEPTAVDGSGDGDAPRPVGGEDEPSHNVNIVENASAQAVDVSAQAEAGDAEVTAKLKRSMQAKKASAARWALYYSQRESAGPNASTTQGQRLPGSKAAVVVSPRDAGREPTTPKKRKFNASSKNSKALTVETQRMELRSRGAKANFSIPASRLISLQAADTESDTLHQQKPPPIIQRQIAALVDVEVIGPPPRSAGMQKPRAEQGNSETSTTAALLREERKKIQMEEMRSRGFNSWEQVFGLCKDDAMTSNAATNGVLAQPVFPASLDTVGAVLAERPSKGSGQEEIGGVQQPAKAIEAVGP